MKWKCNILAVLMVLMTVAGHAQKVEPTWESLNSRPYPQWFSDAKLGIFIHWGLYSVPAYAGLEGYGEWYYRGLMLGDTVRVKFQNRVYGEPGKDFQYKDFAKYYKGELFDPDEWASLFAKSGAKYVVLVTKHHDGYCLWDSKYTSPYRPDWNSVLSGPHRNIVEELTNAVRKTDMKMGMYYSLMEWTNPLHRWTVDSTNTAEKYVTEYMMPQFKELVTRYRPSLIFSDGDWDYTAEQLHSAEVIAWYYNTVGPEAIVNDRWGNGNRHGFRTPEYSAGITRIDRPWAECRGLGRSFGLNRREPLENYITSDELIRHFAKLVAAGGGLTLNVGPAADGQIPLLQQERLLDLGKWLSINGEAIYGSRPYRKFYEMEPVKVTRRDPGIDFYWKRNSPDPVLSCDNFTGIWKGSLTGSHTELYTFRVETEDAVRLVLDGQTVIDYDPEREGASKEGTFRLAAGKPCRLECRFHEKDLEAGITLYWSSESQKEEAVPAGAFSCHGKPGLEAEYSSERCTLCYTTQGDTLYAIALDYPQDRLELAVPEPAGRLQVRMLGCDKVLPWRYESGRLIIDTRPLQYKDIKSTAAWVFRLAPEKR